MAFSTAAALQSAPASAAPKKFDVAVSSESPLPTTVPVDQLPAQDGTVSVTAATPSGFALRNPGIRRSDWVYDSDKVYQGSYRCTSTVCTLAAEVTVQLHQEAIGNTSHTWRLTQHMDFSRNPGGLTWSYGASYWCGVNISGASDTLCTNGAAPSNASMSVNTVVNKPWGATNSITVFPMVQATTVFSNGVTTTTKFRGWDTLSRSSTTKLSASSDGA
jgi:hypothetical protein